MQSSNKFIGVKSMNKKIIKTFMYFITLWALFIMFWNSAAYAETKPKQMLRFDIQKMTAEKSLTVFAEQADLDSIFRFKDVEGQLTNRLVGKYTAVVALTRLLENTALTGAINTKGQLVISKTNKSTGNNMFKKTTLASAIIASLVSAGSNAYAQTNQAVEDKIEVIEVTGIRSSLVKSLELKRSNSTISDAINAEDIGKFPDANIADSLGRITGIQVGRSTGGEGQFVSVRGLSSKFNLATLNGRVIATDTNGRNFSFDVMPSEAISSAEVYKSSMAKNLEGSIGGQVELKTMSPLSKPGTHISANVGGYYDDSTGDTTPNVSGVYSHTFNDDTMGIFLGASYYSRNYRADTFQNLNAGNESAGDLGDGRLIFPGIPSYQIKLGERERLGLVAGFEYRINDDIETKVDAFYSDYKTPENAYSYNINFYTAGGGDKFSLLDGFGADTKFDSFSAIPTGDGDVTGVVTQAKFRDLPLEVGNDTKNRQAETWMLGWNTKWQINDNLKAEFDVAYSEADRANPGTEAFTVTGLRFAGDTYYDLTKGIIPEVTCTLDSDGSSCLDVPYEDLGLHFTVFRGDQTKDTASSYKLDFDYILDTSTFDTNLEFGFFMSNRLKDKDFFRPVNGCGYCGFRDIIADQGVDARVPFPEGGYKAGNIDNWHALDVDLLREAMILARGQEHFDSTVKGVLRNRESSEVEEDTYGTYLQANLSGDNWSGNVGVRYINTETVSRGHSQELLTLTRIPNSTNAEGTFSEERPVDFKQEYDYFLPSANFSYEIQDDLIIRAAASQTITRPNISQMGVDVAWHISVPPFRKELKGNPDLQPTEATSYDLSLEWYGTEGTSASAAVFIKDIKNHVIIGNFSDTVLGEQVIVQGPINGGTAEINGLELAAQQLFENGLGLLVNYTYVDSKAKSVIDGVQVKSDFEGISDTTYNISGFYEDGPYSIRLNYSYRSDYVECTVCSRGLPRVTEAQAFVDFSASYEINDYVSMYLDAFNLTDEEQLTYTVDNRYATYYEQYSKRFEFGVRATF